MRERAKQAYKKAAKLIEKKRLRGVVKTSMDNPIEILSE
jgi:hypothetical protein